MYFGKQVPKMAAEKMRSQLEKSRKRSTDVELTYVFISYVMLTVF